jgi:hypothetical protein
LLAGAIQPCQDYNFASNKLTYPQERYGAANTADLWAISGPSKASPGAVRPLLSICINCILVSRQTSTAQRIAAGLSPRARTAALRRDPDFGQPFH